jgi:hypothetical protein
VSRSGYYALSPGSGTVVRISGDILRHVAPSVLIVVALLFVGRQKLDRSLLLNGIILWGAAFVYSALMLNKAQDFTYHLAPALMLFAMGTAYFIAAYERERSLATPAVILVAALAIYYPHKIPRYLQLLYPKLEARSEVIAALKTLTIRKPIGTTCLIDQVSVGYLATGVEDSTDCSYRPQQMLSLKECCVKVGAVALLQECPAFDEHLAEATGMGYAVIHTGQRSAVVVCP